LKNSFFECIDSFFELKVAPFVLQETGLRVNTVSLVLASIAAGPERVLRAIQSLLWCVVQCLVPRDIAKVCSFNLSVRAGILIGHTSCS
jgi:hypothetical protein